MANQKLPIIDWTSGKIEELPSVEEKKAFEEYCKSKGIEELDIDEFYDTLKDFKNKDNTYEVVNDKSLDAIKDNFTPPGAKDEENEVDEDELYDQMESMGDLPSDMQLHKDLKKVDTSDNGEIEVDEMEDFQKSLDDYAAKNKKGRDDIPVTTRR